MAEPREEPEAETEKAIDQANPAAVALALGRSSKGGKGFDEDARTFLREQTDLIRLQKEHLHEQRELQTSRLRWGRFSDRMKALLQVMTAAVGLIIAIGIGSLAWSAAHEHGLVIESFSVPPDLAQKGLTGQVVASMLLDRLGEMQNQTMSVRAPSTYANDWNGDVKVEIPETGVSVGELYRLFVRWLGRQTSISGELYRSPTGVALVARTGTAPAKAHTGAEGDLESLVQAAAEDVYATTQPYRYAIYLQRAKDAAGVERGRRALSDLANSGDPTDRIWALAGLNLALQDQGDFAGALRVASQAIAIEPRFNLPYANRGGAEVFLGHDEAALADTRAAALTARKYGSRFMKRSALAYVLPNWQAVAQAGVGDFSGAARTFAPGLAYDPDSLNQRRQLVVFQTRAHDVAAARASAALSPPPPAADASVDAALDRWDDQTDAAGMAFQLEDWAQVRTILAGVDARQFLPGVLKRQQTGVTPYLALALAKLGDAAGAQALIAATPLDCYLCVRMRGQIAATAHEWPAAQRWFAEAVRQGPSLPFAETDWGLMLLDEGDPDAAVVKLEAAAKKGPHFADPQELWGEALMRKGDFAGAAGRFEAADRDAPHWGRNHLRWGEALAKLGRMDEARAQWRTAAGLELSAADRATLQGLLKAA